MRIKILLKNKEQKSFDRLNDNIFDLIKQEYENSNLLCIDITVRENDMQIEFGYNCFFVSMTSEEKSEIYNSINIKENSNEFTDLFANCYHKRMLLNDIVDLVEIIQTFIENGEPDNRYKWEIISM
jgi:hypothetical protein